MILVIEDDETIRNSLALSLKAAALGETLAAANGDDGLTLARTRLPSLAILGHAPPLLDAMEICREIRRDAATRTMHVLIIADFCEEREILKGFDAGADDCVLKPFSMPVLIARIRAILRRCNDGENDGLRLDGLAIDESAHSATLNGEPLSLTPTEYGILCHLLRRQGRVWSRSQIIEAVNGYDSDVTERSVDVQLVGLRRKLGAWSSHIESVRSVGYKIS